MSLLRLTLTRSPAPATHFLPALRSCPLRPQLLRKSLPPHSLRRPFASSAPPPRSHGSGTAATTPTASKPATASPGSTPTCALIPFAYVAYFSAPFVTHVFLRLPPAARSSRALLERYVRALPATAQLEVGTLGLAGRPRATLVSAADLRAVPADAGFRETRARLVTHTRDVADLMARKKWYHYRPVSLFGLPAREAGRASKSSGYRNAAKDAWVYDIIRPMLGQR
ncbi:4-coumarate-CoA ligase 2, partial [Colletotrichum asianum]